MSRPEDFIIENGVLNKYIGLEESVVIPNSVTGIGTVAFGGCTGLTHIEIPNSVTGIGEGAFEGCTGLTHIEIPNSVTKIDDYAFSGCNATLKVKENSYAHKYAKENGIKFELV